MDIQAVLSSEFQTAPAIIGKIVSLIDEGNTIPFIARYRKEMHGAMDDTTLRNLETRLTYLRNLQQRRDEVKKSIENQGKLTQELSEAIDAAATMTEVEDLYRPYKQKRRTRGSIAREKGLDPLAQAIFAQDGQDIQELAKDFINEEKVSLQRKRPLPVPWTLSPKTFPMTRTSAKPCGSCAAAEEASSVKPRTLRPILCISSITTSTSPFPGCWTTRSLPSTEVKRKTS